MYDYNIRVNKLNLDLRVIPYESGKIIFDTRSFSIIKVNKVVGDVAKNLSEHTLESIVEKLSPFYEKEAIVHSFLKLQKLQEIGVFSSEEPECPNLPGLQNLILMLAGGCNMGCTYCFESDKPTYKALNLLNKDKATHILKWYDKNHKGDHMHLQLYGGEPLLNWSVLEYVVDKFEEIAKKREKSKSIYMITNGTLLNKKRCEYLIDKDIEIQISLDGNKTQNSLRVFKNGKETFEKVVPWLDYLRERGARFNVRSVLTPFNNSPESAISSLEKIGIKAVSYGVISTNKDILRFKGGDLSNLVNAQINHINRRMNLFLNNIENDTIVPANVRAIAKRIMRGQKIFFHCNAGVTEVTITPDGKIYECQRLISEDPIYINTENWYETAKKFLIPVTKKESCHKCFARFNCGGGCKEANIIETGEDRPWSEYCIIKKTEVDAAIVYSFIKMKQKPNLKRRKVNERIRFTKR